MSEYSSEEQPRILLSPSAKREMQRPVMRIAYRINRIDLGGRGGSADLKDGTDSWDAQLGCTRKLSNVNRKVGTEKSVRNPLKSRFHLSFPVINSRAKSHTRCPQSAQTRTICIKISESSVHYFLCISPSAKDPMLPHVTKGLSFRVAIAVEDARV
jgi:hypothetical protein